MKVPSILRKRTAVVRGKCVDCRNPPKVWPRFGVPIVEGYPYIDAEIAWACREYACTIEDVLSRRTRLAFLNRDAALAAIPHVAEIMAKELGWSKEVKAKQMQAARVYVESYAGRIPDKHGAKLRDATYRDVQDIFNAIDRDGNGYLDRQEIGEVAEVLGFPLTEQELNKAFQELDRDGNGRISLEEFEHWWNHDERICLSKESSQRTWSWWPSKRRYQENGIRYLPWIRMRVWSLSALHILNQPVRIVPFRLILSKVEASTRTAMPTVIARV